ncbi:hypothetical protein CBR_g39816 [Chara braunii]|uniref:Uncharacterized protein n=1 Tax=Chara braunii TaxID=69332 RepID=A0A388LSC4_CHABU|nr:hypothetical protein CBR_g39816 [Chara braunii]|eukprot:GBG85250.1 hypothetical protein CBR_g39816 [Chara braunii]
MGGGTVPPLERVGKSNAANGQSPKRGNMISANRSVTNVPTKSHVIEFYNPPVPLLRIPVPEEAASVGDNTETSDRIAGKPMYVLAFPDEASKNAAWDRCKERIATQCEAGARMGCSIAASRKCQLPWYMNVLPFRGPKSSQELREECEERVMEACIADSKQRCAAHAADACAPAFACARVAGPEFTEDDGK